MCIQYRWMYNQKYNPNTKKNGGVAPPLNDKRQEYIKIPCKECYVCRRKKAREWQMRLSEDLKYNKNAKVIMLTFSTESLIKIKRKLKGVTGYELDNQICKWAVKHFRERWRKKYGRSIRHWFISELGHGKTEHVHMHGLVWMDDRYKIENDFLNEVEKIWQYGFVGKGRINWETKKFDNWIGPETANYFVKYVNKKDEKHKEYKQIILTSAGIGKKFLESKNANQNKYRGKETIQMYQIENGGVLPMPEYFRRKLYNDEEREKLTGYMLDENIIYIDGKKYRADIGDDKISKMLVALREKNKRMGFGDGTKNWERKKLENERRRAKHRERGLESNKYIEDRFEKKIRLYYEKIEMKRRQRRAAWDRFAKTQNSVMLIKDRCHR